MSFKNDVSEIGKKAIDQLDMASVHQMMRYSQSVLQAENEMTQKESSAFRAMFCACEDILGLYTIHTMAEAEKNG